MKRYAVEVIALLVLASVAGVVANVVRRGDDEKFLPWSTSVYGDPVVKPRPRPAPDGGTTPDAGGTDIVQPGGEAPPAGGGGTPGIDTPPDSPVEPVTPPDSPVDHGDEEDEFARLEFEDAVAEFEAGSTFIDARRTRDYVEGHITGSVSISPYEQASLGEKIELLRARTPEEATVIVYCTASADCEDSAMIARQLILIGFLDVRIYSGGFPEWDAKLEKDPRRGQWITVGEDAGGEEG